MKISATNIKKKIKKELSDIDTEYKFLETDLIKYYAFELAETNYNQNNLFKKNTEEYISQTINQLVSHILIPNGFIEINPDSSLKITDKGLIATHLQEIHSLTFADIYIKSDGFIEFNASQISSILSCFTNLNVPDDLKNKYPETQSYFINIITMDFINSLNHYESLETSLKINSGSSYEINFDIQREILDWCSCNNEEECKQLIEYIKIKKNISLGDFVKAILKINNIAKEIEKICEIKNNIVLLEKIKQIPKLTLKYIVTNQSLYL